MEVIVKLDIQADMPTVNGRIYPKEVLKKAIEECQEKIQKGQLFGTIGNNDGIDINLKNISNIVNSIEMNDNGEVLAKLTFLDNDNGIITEELIKKGLGIFTMKAIGNFDENSNVKEISEIKSLYIKPTHTELIDVLAVETEADYKAALDSIRKLWDSKPNTPEGDKLERLIILVEAYEAKHDIISDKNII
jgi:hypothetical protein